MKNTLSIYILGILTLATSACRLQAQRSVNATPSVSVALSADLRQEMLDAVNALRQKGCRCGRKSMPAVPPLTWNSLLEKSAMRHAADMARNKHFSHTGTDGSGLDDRITAAGYPWMQIGENIAWGYPSVQSVVEGWIKSPSHCQQMMSAKVDEMGAARSGQYWVQDFGKKRTW